ncbi:hypothetical protein UFOVP584_52 [uncultured Caudovirales phage]|uniref:Uncharacterized protein n=1 Tax=uncultured Caudovirales phage TaxID=2100421 RepID=A0A6J5N473_9CAUD|nr:hypothetical protein UFOVP304_25 [uncultured Caudovirales phage]CAB4152123.1 hypothetical protein UFOVP584_52 [uncultured Caudovirales phage]
MMNNNILYQRRFNKSLVEKMDEYLTELKQELKKMSEQDKALELISKFVNLGFTLDSAKQCALIAVDEIIDLLDKEGYGNDYIVNFWNRVKQHIENL